MQLDYSDNPRGDVAPVSGVGFLPLIPLLWLGGAALVGGLSFLGAEKLTEGAKETLTVQPGATVVQAPTTFAGNIGQQVGKGMNTVLMIALAAGAAYFLFPGAIKGFVRRRK